MSAAAPTEAPPISEEDIAILLSSLGEDNLACEARHRENGNLECTVTVTHRERLTCRGEVRNVCAAEAKNTLTYTGHCAHCQRPVKTCWIVNPI